MNLKHLGQIADSDKNSETPLFSEYVQVGWPSPADDYIEKSIDLHQLLIKAPAATYLVRANGDSMLNAGINNGAILIVDRSLEPKHGDIVIASIDGAYACKRLQLTPKWVYYQRTLNTHQFFKERRRARHNGSCYRGNKSILRCLL